MDIWYYVLTPFVAADRCFTIFLRQLRRALIVFARSSS